MAPESSRSLSADEPETPGRTSYATSATSARSPSSISSREAFIAHLSGRLETNPPTARFRPQVLGIHHFKFAVTNLDVSIAWYERVLGARRIPELDHVRSDGYRFAAVCHMADWDGLYLELRQAEAQARHARGWDPITLSVASRSGLLHWVEWLDRWGTTHTSVESGVRGWILTFSDPDGRHIRLFTRESHHGLTSPPTASG